MLAVVVGGITVFTIVQQSPDLDPDRLVLTQGSEIFDQNDAQVSIELARTLSSILSNRDSRRFNILTISSISARCY